MVGICLLAGNILLLLSVSILAQGLRNARLVSFARLFQPVPTVRKNVVIASSTEVLIVPAGCPRKVLGCIVAFWSLVDLCAISALSRTSHELAERELASRDGKQPEEEPSPRRD